MPRKKTSSRNTSKKKISPRKTSKKSRAPKKATKIAVALGRSAGSAERRVRDFIESGRSDLKRARGFVSQTGRDLSKQTEAFRSDLAHRVSELGKRVEQERKTLGKKVDGTVKTTLASLNIPTRSEINLLARRVEQLSRKIDGLKKR